MTMSNVTSASGEASASSGNRGDSGGVPAPQAQPLAAAAQTASGQPPPVKKKRNLPGTPDPDAEVIALSPKTLMATNRFVCEICGKGFQRDQNLQLHRRGHNLPWKLRQRSSKEPRKRVYICPEPSCVHHDPSRALGDLTGIKKHFCRKHGEKKWKCDKCNKRYAVQSDWKAHSKTCGTREYRCDCGTLFSRRDSFITHRAFCDALAEESARVQGIKPGAAVAAMHGHGGADQSILGANSSISSMLGGPNSSVYRVQSSIPTDLHGPGMNEEEFSMLSSRWNSASAPTSAPRLSLWLGSGPGPGPPNQQQILIGSSNPSPNQYDPSQINPLDMSNSQYSMHPPSNKAGLSSMFGTQFDMDHLGQSGKGFMNQYSNPFGASGLSGYGAAAANFSELNSTSAGLASSSTTSNPAGNLSSMYSIGGQPRHSSAAQMSATALLQKAAQMGATASNSSLLRGFGLAGSDSISGFGSGGSFWQGNRPDQGSGSSLMRRSNDISADFGATGSGQSPNSSGFGDQSEMGDQSGGSMSAYASIFGSGLNQFSPLFGSNNNGAAGLMGRNSPNQMGTSRNNSYAESMKDSSSSQQMCGDQNPNAGMMEGMNLPKVEEASDGLTRDFLGVRNTSSMPGAGVGAMVRNFSPREIASLASAGLFHRDGSSMKMVGSASGTADSGASPDKSWDCS